MFRFTPCTKPKSRTGHTGSTQSLTMFEKFTVPEESKDSAVVQYSLENLNKRLSALELRIKETWLDTLEDVAVEVQDNLDGVTPELERRSERMARELFPIPQDSCVRQWLKDNDRDFSEMTEALIPFEQAFRTKVRNGLIKMSDDIGLDLENYN